MGGIYGLYADASLVAWCVDARPDRRVCVWWRLGILPPPMQYEYMVNTQRLRETAKTHSGFTDSVTVPPGVDSVEFDLVARKSAAGGAFTSVKNE